MPLKINWRLIATGESLQINVPVLDAGLTLTMIDDVVVEASWYLGDVINPLNSPQAIKIQKYLQEPDNNDLHIDLLKQGTTFSNRVWEALLAIPIGQVQSYSALAEKLHSGSRAVAQACRNNPYAGIIPCHRVVAKSGIGGFMGQSRGEFVGLKQRLLDYERGLQLGKT
jgi:methylated-DNA-[protein]-cysteine S-methyltransferase